jgi:hypothetical protein
MADVLKILYEEDLKGEFGTQLDQIAILMTKWDKQFYMTSGTNPEMPRVLFKDGVTQLTKLSHSHVVGMMLSIVMISLTTAGEKLFLAAFKRRGHADPGKRLNDMRYVCQLLLAYCSWLKKKKYWRLGDTPKKKQRRQSKKCCPF